MASRCVVGVDIGGTKLLAGAIDEQLQVHARVRRPTAELDQRELVQTIVEVVAELEHAAPDGLAAVGLGVPALMDQERGVAVTAVNLPLVDLALRDLMAERIDLPVFMDNDGNVTALAEQRHGAARGHDHVVALTIGTGIGSGLILDGALYRGSTGAASELGHMVIDANGPPCQGFCPNHGCLEALASGTALEREARELARERPQSGLGRAMATGSEIRGPLVTELAFDGDEAAREALRRIGTSLGVGIASCVNIFNPEVVVIGGGVIAAGDLLLEPARAEMLRRALRPSRDLVRVAPAAFGSDAGMIGAGTLALEGVRQASVETR